MTMRPRAILVLLAALVGAGCAVPLSVAAPSTEIVNGDFETAAGELPAGWALDPAARGKGRVVLVEGYRGARGRVLELRPNSDNVGDKPLGVGQVLDTQRFRGRRVTVRSALGATGGATAVVGVHALGRSGDLGFVQISQGDSGGALVVQEKTLDVPAAAENLVVYAIVAGTAGSAVFDLISVGVDPSAPAQAPAGAGAPGSRGVADAKLIVDVSRSVRQVPRELFGTNVEWIFDGQGIWSSRLQVLDPDVIRLARTLGPTLVRFPGGAWSDFYHWRNGTGPQDRRPVTAHHPSGPKSKHSLGIGEVAELARLIGAELLLTVNAGTGTPEEAAAWVRYMNREVGPKVRLWEVGNELYMRDDITGGHMTAGAYARKFLDFAAAMRAVDPSVRIGAIGGLNYGNYRFIADDRWTETLLRRAAAQMDFLAVHNAYAPIVIGVDDSIDPRTVYASMLAAGTLIEANLRDVSRLLEKFEKPGRPIGIAVTEWGPLFHVLPESRWVDHVKTMGSALFVASALNSFMRSPRVEIANFFKLTGRDFMGWIGVREGQWAETASYKVFAMYRAHAGRTVAPTEVRGPTYDAKGVGVISAVRGVPLLDSVATVGADTVSVLLVNRSDSLALECQIALQGVSGYGAVHIESLYADSLDSHLGTELPAIPGIRWGRQASLGHFERGGPEQIKSAVESMDGASGGSLRYRVRPLSVTQLTFKAVRR